VKWKLAILRRRFKDLSWQWNGTSGMLKTIYKFVYCNIYYIIARLLEIFILIIAITQTTMYRLGSRKAAVSWLLG
jgi:hypothetical protein